MNLLHIPSIALDVAPVPFFLMLGTGFIVIAAVVAALVVGIILIVRAAKKKK